MSTELERLAAHKAQEAVYFDKAGSTNKAVSRYKEAIDILSKICNLTDDNALRHVFMEKIKQYQTRIEALKTGGEEQMTSLASTSSSRQNYREVVMTEKPRVSWTDIVDLEEAKKAIRESIVFPLKRPDLFPLGWPKGILIFGPPGCGKTLLVAAVANEVDASFFFVDAASIMSKWLGESERNVAKLFNQCRQAAKNGKPAIIFIDEVDSLTSERHLEVGGEARMRNQLIKEMDSVLDKGRTDYVYVIAATNKPWHLDEPFIRRFQKRIFVPLPDLQARIALFSKYTKGLNLDSSVDVQQLSLLTDGYSGADIHDVCMECQLRVVDELFSHEDFETKATRPITMDDFLDVLKKRKPSIALENMQRLMKWASNYATS